MYKVIEAFTDRLTGIVYYPGDIYPREGEPDAERVKELITEANAHGVPLIEEEKKAPAKKPVKAKKKAE